MNAALLTDQPALSERARTLPLGQVAVRQSLLSPARIESPLRLTLAEEIVVADTPIPAGTYDVSVEEARERVILRGAAGTFALRAFFRRARERGPYCAATVSANDALPKRALLTVRIGNGQEWMS